MYHFGVLMCANCTTVVVVGVEAILFCCVVTTLTGNNVVEA